MEIERKWMVDSWPEKEMPLVKEQKMRQGYVTVDPTVRIREEQSTGESAAYILCFKSKGGLARQEIEMPLTKEVFASLEELIGLPLIPKIRRTYRMADGLCLEVNHVDEGLPTEFWYAEVEFETVEQAQNWRPEDAGLSSYLNNEVTGIPAQTMGAYWMRTRKKW